MVWVRVSDPDRPSTARLLCVAGRHRETHSSGSGCKLKSFSPAAFFSAYFFIQASQLFPAAVSRPENASAAISAYDIEILSLQFLGSIRTTDSLRAAPARRSLPHPPLLQRSLCLPS